MYLITNYYFSNIVTYSHYFYSKQFFFFNVSKKNLTNYKCLELFPNLPPILLSVSTIMWVNQIAYQQAYTSMLFHKMP